MDPSHIPTTTTTEDQNSKTTTDEPDQTNDMGSGRSYECVFCKRGFTTAQALGGHMNIHRKDRVKTKPNTTNNPSKPEPFSHHSTLRPTTTTTPPLISTSHHQSFQTYFPTSSTWCLGSTATSTTTPPHDHQLAYVHTSNTPQALNTFKENWTNIGLASRSPTPNLIGRRDKRSDGNDDDDDDDNDDELDLELRLGHDR